MRYLATLAMLLLSTAAYAVDYKQSPALDEAVSSGALPPVEERLPTEPLVLVSGMEALESDLDVQIGTYGGTLRVPFIGSRSFEYVFGNAEQPLTQPGLGSTDNMPSPNIVKGYTVSEDGKSITFQLREGMRWSDGEPLTTEDVRFWWEDVINNSELKASVDSIWTSDGKPMAMEIVDPMIFTISFEKPYVSVLWELSLRWRNWDKEFFMPSHYLRQFHEKYADPVELEKRIAEAGLSPGEWAKHFWNFGWGPGDNGPDEVLTAPLNVPSLNPYYVAEHPSTNVWVAKRNPYYWKVDAEGNQLPYIDEVRMELIENPQVANLKVLGGEVDFLRDIVSTFDTPLYRENEATGNYRTILLQHHASLYYGFNYAGLEGNAFTELLADARFRQALNMALDRNEIVETLYLGLAELPQTVPSTFDVERANRLLDEIGLTNRDADGVRLDAQGRRVSFEYEYAEIDSAVTTLNQLVQQYWQAIGVEFKPKVIAGQLWQERVWGGQLPMYMLYDNLAAAKGNPAMWQRQVGAQYFRMGADFGRWYLSNGAQGREPTGDAKDVFDLAAAMRAAPTMDVLHAEWQNTLKLLHDKVIWIIPVENIVLPVIASNRLRNVPETGSALGANLGLELFYFDN